MGNAADSTGYGAVDYPYQFGKYHVTSAQYCVLLNAVAVSDPYELYNTNMEVGHLAARMEAQEGMLLALGSKMGYPPEKIGRF